ncbi:MAG: class I SAM-dependent methyltransferase [Anaerolineae bacterium]|nr:class I SAM-dependent methyltransferase [Anaerolineae bacterium]
MRLYDEIIHSLRQTYDNHAAERNTYVLQDWKIAERAQFLAQLQAENKRRLLEIGAGVGKDSLFFKESGLDVVCTDLSPEMVAICQSKGLPAYVMDFLNLDFPDASFDAVYALNCLLHVPKTDLPNVLAEIHRLLKPSGLFFMGVYGGHNFEGIWPQDDYTPKRFFAFYTDEQIQSVVSAVFDLLYFKTIPVKGDDISHFQSMILKPR